MSTDRSGSDSADTFKNFMQCYSEEELGTLLIAGGAVLLFVHGINIVGFIVMGIGAIVWFTDWLWG